ncbi:MAG: MlaD family protein [Prevotellaceae bacterium]|jgi:phospholipid/cholesterol/gamma-HCH transport system substrate-binding protein|nr:MlaD family protein [Prevotellaceae bacterium]
MKKKILTKEVKVGIMAIVAIFLLYFTLNFLKGKNIFHPVNYYYASYEDIGGLIPSAPVYIKGYKVGQVDEITYDFSKKETFTALISISKDIELPHGTIINLIDDGLLGGKAIEIMVNQTNTAANNIHKSYDTLPSSVSEGLLGQLQQSLLPKINQAINNIDSILGLAINLLEDESLSNSLKSIDRLTADLAHSSSQLKTFMQRDVPNILTNVDSLSADLGQFGSNLKEIDLQATVANIDKTIGSLNRMTEKMNDPNGTIGLLLNDNKLYDNLNNTANSAEKLLIDLKENPKKYVHFSLFGKDKKK